MIDRTKANRKRLWRDPFPDGMTVSYQILLSRERFWRNVCGRHTERPFDAFKHHRLEPRVVPGGVGMSPANVEYASLAVLACPDHGKVAVGATCTVSGIQRLRVETHDDMDLVS